MISDLHWRAKHLFSPQSKRLPDRLFYDVRFERSDGSISLIAEVSEQQTNKNKIKHRVLGYENVIFTVNVDQPGRAQ